MFLVFHCHILSSCLSFCNSFSFSFFFFFFFIPLSLLLLQFLALIVHNLRLNIPRFVKPALRKPFIHFSSFFSWGILFFALLAVNEISLQKVNVLSSLSPIALLFEAVIVCVAKLCQELFFLLLFFFFSFSLLEKILVARILSLFTLAVLLVLFSCSC